MKATQGATGGDDRAHASFGNPRDGIASGACPDELRMELHGVCGVCVGCEGDVGWRFWGGEEKGMIAGGSREAVGHCHEGN